MEIDKTTLNDLSILNIEDDFSVFNKMNFCKTAGGKHKFRNGDFVVKEEEKAHELAKQIKLFSAFPHHTSGAFAEAIGRIIKAKKICINDLLKKFQKDPMQLSSCRNAKSYLVALESIYNAGNRTRQIIF